MLTIEAELVAGNAGGAFDAFGVNVEVILGRRNRLFRPQLFFDCPSETPEAAELELDEVVEELEEEEEEVNGLLDREAAEGLQQVGSGW